MWRWLLEKERHQGLAASISTAATHHRESLGAEVEAGTGSTADRLAVGELILPHQGFIDVEYEEQLLEVSTELPQVVRCEGHMLITELLCRHNISLLLE